MPHESAQPNNQTVPPTDVAPAAAPQGWNAVGNSWIIESGFVEDEVAEDEMAARRERYAQRTKYAEGLLQEEFSDRNLDTAVISEYDRTISDIVVTTIEDVADTDEFRRRAIARHNKDINSLARGLAHVPEDFENGTVVERVKTLSRIAHALNPDNPDPSFGMSLGNEQGSDTDNELIADFAARWHDGVLGIDDRKEQYRRTKGFREVIDTLWYLRRSPKRVIEDTTKSSLFDAAVEVYADTYDYEVAQGHSKESQKLASITQSQALEISMGWSDPAQAHFMLTVFEAVSNGDPEFGYKFIDTVRSYARTHALDQQTTDSLIKNVMPRMEKEDSSVDILNRGGNIFGMDRDDFGVGDFYMHSLTQEVTPGNINELLMVMREIPASTQERLEQNRQDGLRLVSTFGILRDFIHDERPGVHEVINAMVEYGKTGKSERLVAAMSKADYFHVNNYDQPMLDQSNYGQQIEPGYGKPEEPVMAILERLEKNTRPVDEEPPEATDEVLAGLLTDAYAAGPRDKKETVAAVTRYLNEQLTAMMDEHTIGIEPSMIRAIAWADREQFKVLQGLTYEDQIRLPRQQWFKDTLRFHELTHNESYDAKEFKQVMESLKGMNDSSAFRAIAGRVLQQTQQLAEKYRARGKDHWTEALWSGNTTHELIGLTDPRKAATAVGRRLLAQSMR